MIAENLYDYAGFEDGIEGIIDKMVRETTYKMDKALLEAFGIKEDVHEIIILTDEMKNIISFVKRDDLTTLKTVRREEAAEIADEIKRQYGAEVK